MQHWGTQPVNNPPQAGTSSFSGGVRDHNSAQQSGKTCVMQTADFQQQAACIQCSTKQAHTPSSKHNLNSAVRPAATCFAVCMCHACSQAPQQQPANIAQAARAQRLCTQTPTHSASCHVISHVVNVPQGALDVALPLAAGVAPAAAVREPAASVAEGALDVAPDLTLANAVAGVGDALAALAKSAGEVGSGLLTCRYNQGSKGRGQASQPGAGSRDT